MIQRQWKLLRSGHNFQVQLISVPNILEPYGSFDGADYLINSGNEGLLGGKLTYFPRGGFSREIFVEESSNLDNPNQNIRSFWGEHY